MEIRVRQRSTTMKRTVNVLSNLNWGTRTCAVLVLCATTAIALPAQTLTTLFRIGKKREQTNKTNRKFLEKPERGDENLRFSRVVRTHGDSPPCADSHHAV